MNQSGAYFGTSAVPVLLIEERRTGQELKDTDDTLLSKKERGEERGDIKVVDEREREKRVQKLI